MSAGILVGTDFSDGSALAVAEGRRLASGLNVPLFLAHVVEGTGESAEGEMAMRSEWLDEVGFVGGDLLLRQGVPAVELARLARELDAGMIVLGTHGASGVQPVVLGSTATRLALLAPCPVVLVGPRGRGRGTGSVTLDRSERAIGQEGRASQPTGPAVSGERC
jgi:nucleotide-binding universal stress UspA family protein